jgi:glycosyltransferase involved in cell wall biosynthesis
MNLQNKPANTDIRVIIPAYNEALSIANVINAIPHGFVSEVVVVNNNSNDQTSKVAEEAGATVLYEKRQGYGWACLKGIDYLRSQQSHLDIIVFMDGDYSDFPGELPIIVEPVIQKDYDMVIGSRALGVRQKGSMLPQQVFGNWLATRLMRLFYGARYTDLGPFRAIKFDKLLLINMEDKTYGWTIEMQLKAIKHKLKYCEVPVSYRKRIGKSKVTGTIKGSIFAGIKILYSIYKYR